MADPILERIHELPVAASWNGFFPQDKPEGPTECVSVATVEAKLVEDGFVKTGVLVAGYQPLENQRLSTTDSPTFAAATIAGWKLRNDPAVPTAYANIYGDGIITPSDSNWSLSIARNGGSAFLNGSSTVGLNVANAPILTADSNRVNIATKLQIAGVDRITNAGGFVGTSLQISGATANKLARFDVSKNLVSYDLVAGDIPNLDTAKITTGTFADARISSSVVWNAKLGTSNVSGYADEVAAFIGSNTVNGDQGLKRYRFGGITTLLALGTPTAADAAFAAQSQVGGTSAFRHYQGPALRFQSILRADGSWALQAHDAYDTLIDAPITVGNGSGGTIALGGGGRPINLTSGSRLQINGTDAVTSERVGDLASLKIAGVERISAAGGFVGTGATLSGQFFSSKTGWTQATAAIALSAADPTIAFYSSGSSVDSRRWNIHTEYNSLIISSRDDADVSGIRALQCYRAAASGRISLSLGNIGTTDLFVPLSAGGILKADATTGLVGFAAAGTDFPNFPILKTVLVKRGTGSQTLYTRNFAANEMNVLGKTIKISFYATALNPAQGDFEVLFGSLSLGHCGIVYGTVSKFEFSFSVETIGTGGKFSTAMVNSNNNGSVYSGADWGSGVNLTASQTLNFNYSQSVAGTVIINQMSVEIINP